MKNIWLLSARAVAVVFAGAVLLAGCSSDSGGSSSLQTGSGDGSVVGSSISLSALGLEYYGASDGTGYNTDVTIMTNASALNALFTEQGSFTADDMVLFNLHDGSDSVALDTGTYTLDSGTEDAMTVSDVGFLVDAEGSAADLLSAEVIADNFYSSRSEAESGLTATIGSFAEIVSGSVTVSRSGDDYTFS